MIQVEIYFGSLIIFLVVNYGGPYLQTQQTSLETQHNIFETQHKIIETQHNIIHTQHKIVETQHNIIQTQHNIIETEHNIIQTQHKIIETQHKIIETQSSMQNWYAIIQRTIPSLVNRWRVMRQTKSPRNMDMFLIKCLVCSEELDLTRLFYSFWKSTMQWKMKYIVSRYPAAGKCF